MMRLTQPDFLNTIMWLKDTGILNKLKYDVMNPPMPIPIPRVRDRGEKAKTNAELKKIDNVLDKEINNALEGVAISLKTIYK